jgi:hypothetical protein
LPMYKCQNLKKHPQCCGKQYLDCDTGGLDIAKG